MLRSAASVLVGSPVDGPPRWMSIEQERQLQRDGEAGGLALQRHTRPAGGGDTEVPGKRRAERHAGSGDLVFGLHGAHAEVLVLGQLVQDVAGRGDRVAAEEHRQLGQLTGGDQTPRQRNVAGDVGVLARRQRRRLDLEADGRTARWCRRSCSRR